MWLKGMSIDNVTFWSLNRANPHPFLDQFWSFLAFKPPLPSLRTMCELLRVSLLRPQTSPLSPIGWPPFFLTDIGLTTPSPKCIIIYAVSLIAYQWLNAIGELKIPSPQILWASSQVYAKKWVWFRNLNEYVVQHFQCDIQSLCENNGAIFHQSKLANEPRNYSRLSNIRHVFYELRVFLFW